MRAAQTVFDQTRVRTDEIINSAERSRTRVSFFLATAVAVLGLFGVSEMLSIKNIWKEASDIRQEQLNITKMSHEIRSDATTLKDLTDKTQTLSTELEDFRKTMGMNRQLIVETRAKIADHIFLPAFSNALKDPDRIEAAIDLYEDLRSLKSDDPTLLLHLLVDEMTGAITTQPREHHLNYTELLGKMLEDARTPEEKLTSYVLLVTNAILVDVRRFENGKTFEAMFAELKKYVREHKGIQMKPQVIEPLKKLFDNESRERKEAFQRLRELIATS